ncbi:MAG: GIY-YIG nuclease family protein [Methylococcales bacterium]|nr:GIY-YIG nuclease family protein [Methylococcales bacterium]
MKGWVYIITNEAMPNLLKVGFSTKDPESRANELDNTGVPHRYVVEYNALVNEPRNVEQQAHVLFKAYHENKEWFRSHDYPQLNQS